MHTCRHEERNPEFPLKNVVSQLLQCFPVKWKWTNHQHVQHNSKTLHGYNSMINKLLELFIFIYSFYFNVTIVYSYYGLSGITFINRSYWNKSSHPNVHFWSIVFLALKKFRGSVRGTATVGTKEFTRFADVTEPKVWEDLMPIKNRINSFRFSRKYNIMLILY